MFIAFTAEEEGLVGSTLYARKAHKDGQIIDAVLNNDIIGDDVGGDGRKNNTAVAVYSEEPADSLSRELARYIRQACERYVPSMRVDLVFRQDRLGRGGDHAPFNQEGYAAVRFTTPEENYKNQHSLTDTVANMSNENPEPDLAGYIVVMRSTTSPFWEKEIFVGNVTEYTMKNVSIDDRIFGVKAVDKDGNTSLVSAYIPRPRPALEIETY